MSRKGLTAMAISLVAKENDILSMWASMCAMYETMSRTIPDMVFRDRRCGGYASASIIFPVL